jgi:phenylpyruvate tautomerase PptA (4-oxalocrotonate tautomerase family)
LGTKVIKMLMRIEDRADKVSNKITHVEERLMRLVYRKHEVCRIISQSIEAANPELKKDWIAGAILQDLELYEEAQFRQGKAVTIEAKAEIISEAMVTAYFAKVSDKKKACIKVTLKDIEDMSEVWFGIQVQGPKKYQDHQGKTKTNILFKK